VRVMSTNIETIDVHRIRVTTVIDTSEQSSSNDEAAPKLGEGPTGTAIPDRIVKVLVDRAPGSVAISEIQKALGGNPATVNRQAWTLANNAPDLQHRLRGWVVSDGRGRYALSVEAINRIPDMKAFHSAITAGL
jgi:hypothetical protein